MVTHYRTALLGDVDDSYYFGVACSTCYCVQRLSLVRLRDLLGWYFKVCDLRKRVSCGRCGARHVLVTFLAPHQNEPRTRRLFERTALRPADLADTSRSSS